MDYLDLRFFQATATVIPTVLIAFAITSKFLDFKRESKDWVGFVVLGGRSGVVAVAIILFGAVTAEGLTLVAIAFDRPHTWIFIVDMFMIVLMAWLVAFKAIEPLLQTLPVRKSAVGVKSIKKEREIFGNVLIGVTLLGMSISTAALGVTMAVTR